VTDDLIVVCSRTFLIGDEIREYSVTVAGNREGPERTDKWGALAKELEALGHEESDMGGIGDGNGMVPVRNHYMKYAVMPQDPVDLVH
jgi:hypothetical protein